MTAAARDYAAIGRSYAEGVLSGETAACEWVRKACRRQLDDFARKDFAYRFDEKKAERVCRFIEKLPHIKGKWAKAGRRIELQPWQIFILTTVFGWVSRETGLRRYKTAYLEMPRKNGKSSMSSGVGIYCCCADGEEGGEIYSAATTRDQAKIVWQDAWHMVERSPGLKAAFGVSTTVHAISQVRTASRFQALSAEGNSIEEELLSIQAKFDLQCVCYDPAGAKQILDHMQAQGLPMIEMSPIVNNFSEPTKLLDALIADGKIRHDCNPVLAWELSNVVGHTDRKDNVYPIKERPENKIDGVIALIMALARAMTGSENPKSIYEKRGPQFV
jgi:phage terminase large subunit-like protein